MDEETEAHTAYLIPKVTGREKGWNLGFSDSRGEMQSSAFTEDWLLERAELGSWMEMASEKMNSVLAALLG